MTDDDATAPDPDGGTADAGADGADAAAAGDGATTGDDGTGEERDLVARVAALDESLADEVASLVETADEREAEVDDLTEKLQRTRADFQNYKKRAKKRQEQLEAQATRDLVERLLDVRDDLGRALDDDSGDVEALREGVELTVEEFDRVLAEEGVSGIEPAAGEAVDPTRHEVLMRVDSDQPADTVAELYRPGYEMDGTVLRPAQVTVSDGDGDD